MKLFVIVHGCSPSGLSGSNEVLVTKLVFCTYCVYQGGREALDLKLDLSSCMILFAELVWTIWARRVRCWSLWDTLTLNYGACLNEIVNGTDRLCWSFLEALLIGKSETCLALCLIWSQIMSVDLSDWVIISFCAYKEVCAYGGDLQAEGEHTRARDLLQQAPFLVPFTDRVRIYTVNFSLYLHVWKYNDRPVISLRRIQPIILVLSCFKS